MSTKARQRLAAILAADVAGYSRLMAEDEGATIALLDDYRAIFRDLIGRNSGRIVDMAGDSVLAVFETAHGAVQSAMSAQEELARRNATLPEARRMAFRIGVHLGDIHEKEDGTVYGDGVNIAARLQGIAEPGAVAISDIVRASVASRLKLGFRDLGPRSAKNIREPIHAFAIDAAADALTPASPANAGKSGEDLSIAVLPLDNVGRNPEEEYFSDGLTEDIITELSRFADIRVLARNSTFRFKGVAVDIIAVGAELGVRYVLESSVRRSGNRVRVTTQLIDAATASHVWAERYDREVDDIFAVQDELTRSIAGTLGARLDFAELDRSVHKPTNDLNAYDCVLRARRYKSALTATEHARARDLLETAVALDPGYSRAHAMLADVYLGEYRFGFNPGQDPLGRAFDEANRSVELDPSNAHAHCWLAIVHFFRHEFERFEAEAERARQLNPNDAEILAELGHYYAFMGQHERGVALMREAMRLNPLHPGWYYFAFARFYYGKREYEQVLVETEKMNLRDFYWQQLITIAALGQLGGAARAAPVVAQLLASRPDLAVAEELYKWGTQGDDLAHLIDGLRKGGIDVAEARH